MCPSSLTLRAGVESPVWRVEYRLHPVWILRRLHTVPGHKCVHTACVQRGFWSCLHLCVFVHLQTHDNKEHLAMMEILQGPIPQRMIQRSRWRTPVHCWSYTNTRENTLCLTHVSFPSQKAEVFPPWAPRLERVLQGRALRESQVQTTKGELRCKVSPRVTRWLP